MKYTRSLPLAILIARFIGDAANHIPGFVDWGTEPGQSLPASYRSSDMNCASDYVFNRTPILATIPAGRI